MAEEIKNNGAGTQQEQLNNENSVENQQEIQNPENQPEVTVESLMARIAQLEAKNVKDKAALDEALKKNGELTKQYRATLTEAQQAKLDKEMEDEEQKTYVRELEQYKQKNEAMKRYMTVQEMSAELAEKAAEAEVSGDMEALSEIQKQHSETKLKAARAEWQGSARQPNFGTGEYSSMTKEEIGNIKDRNERRKAIAQNMNLFNQKG